MFEAIKKFFDTTMFSPHGFCLLWDPELLMVHVASDAIIALSYFSIPFALALFVWKRPDVSFGWLFWAFATFILACGLTHVFAIYTLWVPIYGIEGLVKAVTAAASIVTAALMWPLLPKLLQIPSPSQLQETQLLLQAEAKQRREAEQMLLHSQKMEAVGQLTGGVAHDFNNLLMVILGNLELGQKRMASLAPQLQGTVSRYLTNAQEAARKAARLTERLLAFARRQPLDPKPVRANELVAGMGELLSRAAGENIQVEIVGAAGLWLTEVDPTQLESALLNLVINARDAMPNGGKLTIETANSYVDEEYAAANADVSAGQYVMIAVTDNGIGMDAATADRAFEPFFSTKSVGEGTGLGLSQVYGFTKQSGGHAKIYSEPGEGTTVKLYLPRAASAASTPAAQAQAAAISSGRGEGILIVEDDAAVRGYVRESLDSLNYRTFEAENADAAEALFKERHGEIEMLLTDVVMPGRNGRELSQALQRMKPGLLVVFMTGYSRNAIVHQGRLDRGVEYLQKPISQATLAAKVKSLFDRGG